MKICPDCKHKYLANLVACDKCGYKPVTVDGIEAYAPQLSQESDGFKPDYFAKLAALESDNFWFRARNKLIIWGMSQYAKTFTSYLEIGCGTGYVISAINKHFPKHNLWGSEIFTSGIKFAADRNPEIHFLQLDARNIPFESEFDVIGAFDVIEHIEEDEKTLKEIHKALKNNGLLILTVPQHPILWSKTDEYACHKRRYTKTELHEKLKNAGFKILESTSFVSFLLPVMLLSRLKNNKLSDKEFDATSELRIPSLLNDLFYILMSIEIGLIEIGIRFPAGGSRFVVAGKF